MKYDLRIIALFIFLTSYLILQAPVRAFDIDKTKNVNVSAAIDDNRVFIFGFTSPNSRVELSNIKVFDVTYSKDNGYFEFDRIILPKDPGELCLLAADDNSRHTNPVCIPPPPPTNYLTNIGPIILPPTLTIDSNSVKANSTTAASGQSIPFSDISIYLYQVDSHAPVIPRPVQAFGLPIFTTRTDQQGNYDLNIPTSLSSDYRLFSTVLFATLPSPKSNTITYALPTAQNIVVIIPLFFFSLLLFGYLLYLYFSKKPVHYFPAIFYFPIAVIHKS